MTEREIPEDALALSHRCPWCGRQLDLVSEVDLESPEIFAARQPTPGAASFDIACGEFSIFDDDLRLRKPTDAELVEIANNPVCRRLRDAYVRMLIERATKQT